LKKIVPSLILPITHSLLPIAYCLLLIFSFSSCIKTDLFEKNVIIPKHQWHWGYQPEINFTISDTAAAYTIYITLRHTEAYEYRNLWLFVSTKLPGDTAYNKERLELLLQSPDGKWLAATGMDDIWEHRILLFKGYKFKNPGTYSIRLQQNMRDNPLKHIMNAGVRIEKM
jgi:gliding motility-associated lipoprotein GldH